MQVVQTILDCTVEVPTKSGIYATLVGKFQLPLAYRLYLKICYTQTQALL